MTQQCSMCKSSTGYFEQRSLSGLTPSTYGGISASEYSSVFKIDWNHIIESALTGIMVAVISTYALKAIGESK